MTHSGRINLFAVAVALAVAPCAQAAPITFTFEMPAFTASSVAEMIGATSTLMLTVDDRGVNQTYSQTDLLMASVNVNGTSYTAPYYSYYSLSTPLPYITTDLLGTPTLDLSGSVFSFTEFWGGSGYGAYIQIGSGTGQPYYVQNIPYLYQAAHLRAGPIVVGTTPYSPPVSVPEPATLALMGLGLAAIGWGRKRNTPPTFRPRPVAA